MSCNLIETDDLCILAGIERGISKTARTVAGVVISLALASEVSWELRHASNGSVYVRKTLTAADPDDRITLATGGADGVYTFTLHEADTEGMDAGDYRQCAEAVIGGVTVPLQVGDVEVESAC